MPRRDRFRFLLLAVLALSCAGAGPRPDGPYDRERDLARLAEWVGKEQSFDDERFGLIPVRAYWFADGLFVVQAATEHASLLGMRIDTVGGRPLRNLEERLRDYHGGSESHFRRYAGPLLMLSPPLLHAIGVTDSPDALTIGGVARSGDRVEATLTVAPGIGRKAPWQLLLPSPGEGEWASIHDPGDEVPLYLGESDELFRYELLADGAIAYVQLRSNFGTGRDTVEEFVRHARGRLERDRPRSIVLDNRQNPGGDLGKTADFALALPSLAKDDGKV
jgi:hypothetical protein